MRNVPILGLPIAATDYAGAVDWVLEKARAPRRAWAVEAANTHVVALARHDTAFRMKMQAFDLVCPDGMPLVWMLNRRLGSEDRLTDRVYGPTLMLKAFEATRKDGESYRHFLLGGKESTLEKLRAAMSARYPGARIAGAYSPPFGQWPEDEFERIAENIRRSRANLVWVSFGCPKQESWIARHKEQLPPAVYFGIGAAFAFHAGEVSQAPGFLQRNGLEWCYRMLAEPRRLSGRYLKFNSLFLSYCVWDRLNGRASDGAEPAPCPGDDCNSRRRK